MSLDDLLALEHAGWRSLCEGTGARFYGDLLTPDGVMVLAHGMVLDREAVVASLDEAPPWQEYTIRDARLVPVADASGALVYRASASRAEGSRFEAWMTSVYVRAAGGWRLALYQQTPVPGA